MHITFFSPTTVRLGFFCLVFFTALPVLAANSDSRPLIKLTSLEWPPYTGAALPDKGSSSKVVRAALEAEGYRVQIDFYPWNRAVQLANDPSSGYAGYFPEYFSTDNAKQFLYSTTIGQSPLGLAQREKEPVEFSHLDALSRAPVGVVQGYLNTDELDRRIADGRIRAINAPTDLQNVRNLMSKRISVAVIDGNVLTHLQQTDPNIARANLVMHPKLLELKQLYVCFRPSAENEILKKALAHGLQKQSKNP